jgi:hypothetical protein
MFYFEIVIKELLQCITSGVLGTTGNPNVFQIWYINNFISLPVPYRNPNRVIKIRVSGRGGNNYNSLNSVADPEPGSGAFLITGSRMGKNQDPGLGSGITTRIIFPRA